MATAVPTPTASGYGYGIVPPPGYGGGYPSGAVPGQASAPLIPSPSGASYPSGSSPGAGTMYPGGVNPPAAPPVPSWEQPVPVGGTQSPARSAAQGMDEQTRLQNAQALSAWLEGIASHPGMPNPDQQYVDAFNASLGTQRRAIDNQLASSSQQLAARRDAAAAVVAGMPAQFQQHFNDARQQAGLSAKVAQSGAGGKQAIGGNVNAQLARSVIANTNAAAQSTVPLMQLGVQANYGAGMDQLNAANTQAQAQLASSQMAFDAQMAASANSLANQEALIKFEQAHPAPLTAAQMQSQNNTNNDQAIKNGFTSYAGAAQAIPIADKIAKANMLPKLPSGGYGTNANDDAAYRGALAAALGPYMQDRDVLNQLRQMGLVPPSLVPKLA